MAKLTKVKKSGRPPRTETDVLAMRAKIAAQALALFQEEGFASVSIRRLAKEVGCAPMTIYANFDGKIEILQHLWAVVLDELFTEIRANIEEIEPPKSRLRAACDTFISYWLENPEHFRMVFMSSDISRPDVSTFVQDDATLSHFQFFHGLVHAALPGEPDIKSKADILIAAMIGIALCANTIRDYPWTEARRMTDMMVANIGA